MRPVPKIRAGIPPFDILHKILASSRESRAPAIKTTDSGPWITWLADADTRLQSQQILQNPIQKLFAVRNMGNQLEVSPGLVDYGVRFLHTPVLLITAPNNSRAIEFFFTDYNFLTPEIRKNIDHLRPALTSPKLKGKSAEKPMEHLDFVEANIDYQVQQAVLRYEDRLKNGRLVIIGAVFDLDNKYGRGKNRLILININGEKNGKKLRRARMTKKLDGKLLKFVGRERRI